MNPNYTARSLGFISMGECLCAATKCLVLSGALWAADGLAAGSVLFEQMKAKYQADYSIELVADFETYPVAETGGAVTARNAGAKNVDMALYFLRKEFGRYPLELVQAAGVKRIVFCRDLRAKGERIAGVAVQRNATIYIDSSTEVGDEAHRRRMFHHEFFHHIDYALMIKRRSMENPEWAAANAPGTTYGGGGSAKPVPNWASHPAPGFVSDYAKTAIAEDRAELFAGIMTNNLTLRLLLQKDKFLAGKLALLKSELKEFCPEVDEAFWARVAKNF